MNPSSSDPATHSSRDSPQAASTVNIGASLSDSRGLTEEIEAITYIPVPSKKTVRVSVRYRVRGRGRPLPYPRDAGDIE